MRTHASTTRKTTPPLLLPSISSTRKNPAREVARPQYTLWLVACVGAYDASPRIYTVSRAWGAGACMYLSRLPTTPTTTTNNRHPKKPTNLLLPSSTAIGQKRVRWHIRGVLYCYAVASIGAYDASPRIDTVGKAWGTGACVYLSRLPTTPTTTTNNRHQQQEK